VTGQEIKTLGEELLVQRKLKGKLTGDARWNTRVDNQINTADARIKQLRSRISMLEKLEVEQKKRKAIEDSKRLTVQAAIRNAEYDVVGKGTTLSTKKLGIFASANGRMHSGSSQRVANMKAAQEAQRRKRLATMRPTTTPLSIVEVREHPA
jgi:phosphate-selective porin